ncbi:MAG: nucleotide exchange factor GrpE [Clostridia bacterium]|nr:nucleotide exchange factor GrpE [Clostridia bacterium]
MSNEEKTVQENMEQETVEIPIEDGAEEAEVKEEQPAEEAEAAEETAEEAPEEPAEEPAAETEAGAETADAGADAMTAKYMRLMADFQNFKKRTAKEKQDIYAFGNEKLIISMLEVLDNFDRAIDQGSTDTKFAQGMDMIYEQFMGVLKKAGLAEIEALGADFDPNFHSAVMMEDTDEYESGKVSGVVAKGYTLNDKVIRPSMVKVAK